MPEEPALRKASITRLAAVDIIRKRAEKAAHAERIAVLLAERTAYTRVVSYPGYFNFSPCQRLIRGGIDWYRYQKCVLGLLLLPAYHEFAALHQDRTICNSPDLNPIEYIWSLIKDRVAARRPFIKGKEALGLA